MLALLWRRCWLRFKVKEELFVASARPIKRAVKRPCTCTRDLPYQAIRRSAKFGHHSAVSENRSDRKVSGATPFNTASILRTSSNHPGHRLSHHSTRLYPWPTQTTPEIHGKHLHPKLPPRDDSCSRRSPYVILSDFGSAFAMGAVGGTIWHGIKGARNSPRVRG